MQLPLSVSLSALLAVSTALSVPDHSFSAHANKKRVGGRDPLLVYYRLNDSSIGSTLSTSWDVFSLSASPATGSSAERRGLSLYGRDTCTSSTCTDGPSTNYTVVSGDTLEAIAAKYNSGICDIATANSISNPNYITVGQVLVIPTDLCEPDNNSCINAPGTRVCVPASEGVNSTVTIVSGDTFFILGQKYNVTADAIAAANPCVDATNLQIGQEINVPICPTCTS